MTAPRQHLAIPGAAAPVFYSTVLFGYSTNRSPDMATPADAMTWAETVAKATGPSVKRIEIIARFEIEGTR